MNKTLKQIAILITLIFFLVLPYFVFAVDPMAKLKEVGTTKGPYAEATVTSMSGMIGQVVNIFLSLLGVIFVLLMIYAGYNWMTAAGDEGKVEKAKQTITRAVIGIIITIGAYALTAYVMIKVMAVE